MQFDRDLVKSIRSQSLSTVIRAQLEEMILAGAIKPGERINESRLATLLGVSRAPIREACRQLERHGIIEVRLHRGTFVRKIDLREVEELYEIRAALDSFTGQKAACRATRIQLQELETHLDAMRMASEKNMHHEYFIANLAFHMSIIHMAGNKNLETIYEGVCKRASLFRRTSLSTPGRLAISLKQHQAIFDAIAAGNSEKTAALMHHHIMDAKSVLAASCASPEKTITT